MDFVILPDVTCDLNDELREKFGIEYVPGTFTYPDGFEEEAFLNWDKCTHIPNCKSEDFYAMLSKNPDGFSTAPAGVQKFYNVFESYVKKGMGILSLSISSGISGTYNFTLAAKKQIEENYPDAKIICIDSLRFAAGLGLLAIHASLLRSEGKSLEEVGEYIEKNKIKFHQTGWLDDLSFVAKKGRISNAKAFFGKLVGIKPLGEFDKNGLTTVIAKAKGEKAAYKMLLGYMEALGENLSEQVIIISQTNRLKQAQAFKAMIEEKFSPKAVYINDVFPMNGINIGPGLMAAYYMGKPISEGLEAEKKVYAEVAAKI